MKILVAPDSFKGSLSASRFCEIAKTVIESQVANSTVTMLPLADGGEGTMAALVAGTNGTVKTCTVTGPLKDKVQASYGILGDGNTAVIEMAQASGLPLVAGNKKNPLLTTTFGTGELIKDALDHGIQKIILGLGGSATNDGGSGALQALGLQLLDSTGQLLKPCGESLLKLVTVKTDSLDPRLAKTAIIIASDVTNPLLGNRGATMTYGKQKGANELQLEQLEEALTHFAELTQAVTRKDMKDVAGAGAAGGMGYGFLSYCNAEIRSGFQLIAEMYKLEERLKEEKYNFILTGEGEINMQSVQGKLIGRLAAMGHKYQTPVIALAGNITGDLTELYDTGVVSMQSIVPGPVTVAESMEKAELYLEQKLIDLCELIKGLS